MDQAPGYRSMTGDWSGGQLSAFSHQLGPGLFDLADS
jgi:hypothetical protein